MNISVSLFSRLLATLLLVATGCARSGDSMNPSSDATTDERSQQRIDSAAPIGQPLKDGQPMNNSDQNSPIPPEESNNSIPQVIPPSDAMPSDAPLPSSTASSSSGPASNPSDQPAPRNDGAPSSAPLRPEDLPSAGGGSAPGPSHTLDEQVAMARAILASRRGLENVSPIPGGNGCIMLTGHVVSDAKRNEAVGLARGLAGVKCVVDRVEVR